jgi:hypothetical protein
MKSAVSILFARIKLELRAQPARYAWTKKMIRGQTPFMENAAFSKRLSPVGTG